MNKYKEYKKVIKHEHLDNIRGFNREMDEFLERHQNIKILHTIVHKPYHVTIIYEELKEIIQ